MHKDFSKGGCLFFCSLLCLCIFFFLYIHSQNTASDKCLELSDVPKTLPGAGEGARVYLHPLYACKSTDVSRWTSFPTTKLIKETVTSTKWCGGFFLTCNDFGRMFDHSFTACAFLFLFFWSGDYLAHANSSLYARISPQWLTGPRRTPPYPEEYYTKRHYTEVILMMMMMMILYIPKSIKELCEWCTCLPFVSQVGQAQRFVSASQKEERSTQAGWWGLAPLDPKPSSVHIGSHRPCQSLPDRSKTAAHPLK